MAWIARDKQGDNPYRIFGLKPIRLPMVSYGGEVRPEMQTWTLPYHPRHRNLRNHVDTYGPLFNDETTVIDKADCPVELEPGEGPIEVKLGMVVPPSPRLFEGAGI